MLCYVHCSHQVKYNLMTEIDFHSSIIYCNRALGCEYGLPMVQF